MFPYQDNGESHIRYVTLSNRGIQYVESKSFAGKYIFIYTSQEVNKVDEINI